MLLDEALRQCLAIVAKPQPSLLATQVPMDVMVNPEPDHVKDGQDELETVVLATQEDEPVGPSEPIESTFDFWLAVTMMLTCRLPLDGGIVHVARKRHVPMRQPSTAEPKAA